MGGIVILFLFAVPVALVAVVIVWAMNLGASVHAIEKTLARMEARQSAPAPAPVPAPVPAPAPTPTPATSAAQSAPIDVEPFVD
jgi:atypical dual specificity phosphatase